MGASLPAGGFSPVPAALPAGNTPADISHTWDGVLHAVGQDGAPYVYDRVQRSWSAVGAGIDAAARVGTTIYHFRGPEYVTCEFGVNRVSAPVPITQSWPGLPRSFRLGVCGAASLGGKLYLFAQGRYVCVDEPGDVFALADLMGWPTAPAWADGVIDGTFSLGGDQVMVFRGGEWVTFSISQRQVLTPAPRPLAEFGPFAGYVPGEMLAPGFGGGFTYQDGPPQARQPVTVYAGTTALGWEAGAAAYLPVVYPCWPDSWNPQLAHAFTGRSGALWAATRAGQLVSLEADGFHANPQQAGQVSAGADGSVYFTDRAGTSVYALTDPGTPVYTSPAPLSELSHGRAGEAWALDDTGSAVRITVPGAGAAASAQTMFAAQAISANADGSVWHTGTGGQPARYTDTTGASEPFPGAPAAAMVGSNSAGHGYIVSAAAAGNPASLTIREYTSPFLFKTVGMPQTRVYDSKVAYGGGRVYYCTWEPSPARNRIIACDYESGEVVWTQAVPYDSDYWADMAYSPALDCLVAVSAKNAIGAFRASDGEPFLPEFNEFRDNPADSISVDGSFAATVSEGTNLLTAWDLETGQMVWRFLSPGGHEAPAAPLITDQYVFYMSFQAASGTGCLIYRGDRGSQDAGNETFIWSDNGSVFNHWSLLVAPIASKDLTADEALYFVDGNGDIRAVSFDGSQSFAVSPAKLIGQGAVQITSGLTYAGGCIWFGCTIAGQRGALVGLDTRNGLSLLPHTPFFPDAVATAVPTSPLLYRNPQGQPLVVFGTTGVAKLWAFNPADGSSGSIDTMGTEIAAMTADAPLGIVYCGGAPPGGGADSLTAYYGIRLDQIPLTAPPRYSVVADSQLMQDPDPQAANTGSTSPDNPIPPSAARYQTHLTVVDTGHLPVPGLEVKLYVDQASTGVPLTIQGQPVTVPPSGLVVTTDPAGKITVVSEAAQLTTAALRVWAPFMDNSERMVIHPDHEFHQRVMTAHADAADDDPGKVNLVTAQDYNGNPYFTSQEKSHNAPQQTATAVQQMGTSVGLGTSTPASAAPGAAPGSPGKYVTYADTGGIGYYPADTIAQRPLTAPPAAFALHIARAADGSLAQNRLSLREAGAVIDGLQGDPWTPPPGAAAGPATLGSWWDNFWNWVSAEVEKTAEVIQQVIVTVADVVQVAIQVMDNGILKVFHFIVKTVEDAVRTIGSFFVSLGKLIIHTIEALSLLFNFGEILATHKLIMDLVGKFINGDPGDTQTFPGLANAITNSAIPQVNSFTSGIDAKISSFISWVEGIPGGDHQPISQLKGQGSTEHTAYQVPPKAGSPAPTHTVQCSWGSDAMKRNVPSATVAAPAGAPADSAGTNPLEEFITKFVAGIRSGGDLAADAKNLESDFTDLFSSTHSAADFLATGLKTILDLIQTLVDSIVKLAGGICDGALAAIAEIISDIHDLLTQQIDIPLISWLYNKLTGEPLTILGAALFLVAIPATILYRAITGTNPSQALGPEAPDAGAAALGTAPAAVQLLCAITGAVAGLLLGLISSMADLAGGEDLPAAMALFAATLGLAGVLTSYPPISSKTPLAGDFVRFALSVIGLVPPIFAAYFACGKIKFEAAAKELMDDGTAIMACVIGLVTILAFISEFLETKVSFSADFGFGVGIVAAIPGVVTILKFSPINKALDDGGAVILGFLEMVESIAMVFLQIVLLASFSPALSREAPPALPA